MPATYENIATTTLGSNQSDVTFSAISSSYTDLILVCSYRDTRAQTYSYPKIQVNADTGSNYSQTNLFGDGSTASSNRQSNATSIQIYEAPGANATANVFSPLIIQFNNYSNSTTNKTILIRGNNTGGGAGTVLSAQVGLWRSTSAITSIKILGDTQIASGSVFTLYGIKAA
jgi:hypothetical protein